jgi:hypothetical protein
VATSNRHQKRPDIVGESIEGVFAANAALIGPDRKVILSAQHRGFVKETQSR